MKKLPFFAFFFFAVTFALASVSHAAPVTIRGTALVGPKNTPLAGAQIDLVRPDDRDKRTVIASTRSDSKGHFAFSPFQPGKNDLLMARTILDGFEYWNWAYDGGGHLAANQIKTNTQNVQLLAFAGTTQPVPLQFMVHHLAIESSANGLKCIERIVVQNPGDKTFLGLGPRRVSVLLNLPEGAQNVRLDPKIKGELVKTSDGWGVVKPIPPDAYGEMTALIINYEMAWPSSLPWAKTLDLSRQVTYPTSFFFVARKTDDKVLQVTAPKLGADQEQPLPVDGKDEVRIINAIGRPQGEAVLKSGDELQISASRPVSSLFWGFLALTIGLCIFLPLAMAKPRRGDNRGGKGLLKTPEPVYEGSVNLGTSFTDGFSLPLNGLGTDFALNQNSRDLIQKIADLDDQYEADLLDEAAYQEQRAVWKKSLIESLGTRSDA